MARSTSAWQDRLGFLLREPADTYHAKAKEFLGSHQLAEFRRNPPLFRKRELGLLPEEAPPAFLLGRAAHTLVLEGKEAYEAAYAVGGPIKPEHGGALRHAHPGLPGMGGGPREARHL